MKIFRTVRNYLSSSNVLVDRLLTIDTELAQLQIHKDLFAEQYGQIQKALSSAEFECKEDIRFSESDYIHDLAKIKRSESGLVAERHNILKSIDVRRIYDLKKHIQATRILKSLYRDGKLGLDQYNEVAAEKTSMGQVRYADIIVLTGQDEILLLKRCTWDTTHAGAWVIPGGHIDKGETAEQAAERELLEESGISITNLRNKKIHFEWNHVGTFVNNKAHIDYYCLRITNHDDVEILLDEQETRDYKWVSRDTLDDYEMVFNMKENILEILQWDAFPQVKIIRKTIDIDTFSTDELTLLNMDKQQSASPTIRKAIESFVANKLSQPISLGERRVLYDTFPDVYMDQLKRATDDIQKAFSDGLLSKDLFLKAMKNLSHLVPKKVQVKGQDGKVHQAIRWVRTDTGEGERTVEPKAEVNEGNDVQEKVLNVLRSGIAQSEKMKNLINMGIYDDKTLGVLVGIAPYHVRQLLMRNNVDVSSLNQELNKEIVDTIKSQQEHNDTPADLEKNELLNETRDLDLLWDVYADNMTRVAQGRHKFCLAYGAGGVGKTHTFYKNVVEKLELREYEEEVQPTNAQYDFIIIGGKITPTQVYAEMYRHRDKLIVFDDCDSFLQTEEVQGFLKKGLDTGAQCKIDLKSSRKLYQVEGDKDSGEIPSTFRFTGRVIAITNLTAKDMDKAVLSRAMTSNLTMTTQETIDKLKKIKNNIKIYTADKSSVIDVDQESRDFAFEVTDKYKSRLGNDLNTRTYSNAVLLADDYLKQDKDKDYVERVIKSYFDSIIGSFDETVRSQNKGK